MCVCVGACRVASTGGWVGWEEETTGVGWAEKGNSQQEWGGKGARVRSDCAEREGMVREIERERQKRDKRGHDLTIFGVKGFGGEREGVGGERASCVWRQRQPASVRDCCFSREFSYLSWMAAARDWL